MLIDLPTFYLQIVVIFTLKVQQTTVLSNNKVELKQCCKDYREVVFFKGKDSVDIQMSCTNAILHYN